MELDGNTDGMGRWRAAIVGLVGVIVVVGLGLMLASAASPQGEAVGGEVNALAASNNACVTCHDEATPGIVVQYGHSTMAAGEVRCQDCHEVKQDYPGAEEHEGTHILAQPTVARCQRCHTQQVAQFSQSRHGLPSYVAYAGTGELTEAQLADYEAIPEGGFARDKAPNVLYELEGHGITQFACEQCHDIGKPQLDGSVGDCTKCHLRHEFSIVQARKPETCNNCHIGPDHPQYEIYIESPHGIAHATGGADWNWDAEAGTLEPGDLPAPTCALCHLSGFGATGTTHDVGDRLSWFLAAPVSGHRPTWQDNRVKMQGVCSACHNQEFIDDFYTAADEATARVNELVEQSDDIMQPLKDEGLVTAAPYDEPIDFTHFEVWHHWGRTAKFGVWMQGPDYSQWHGAYEMLKGLAELREMADEKLEAGGH